MKIHLDVWFKGPCSTLMTVSGEWGGLEASVIPEGWTGTRMRGEGCGFLLGSFRRKRMGQSERGQPGKRGPSLGTGGL